MKEELDNILKEAQEVKNNIKNLQDLENFRIKFLGKKGLLKKILEKIIELPENERRESGAYFNFVKDEIEKIYEELKKKLESKQFVKFDIHHPGRKIEKGHLHILTHAIDKIVNIFSKMGFDLELGIEIVTEYENFDSLNMPQDHPSRDMWDTLWIKSDKQRLLLRTHTSAHQVEILKNRNIPLKVIIPGKVYRHEATDSRHEMQFHQLEGLAVGESCNLQELKGVFYIFFEEFFGRKLDIIFRTSYFPFTEPSLEVDIECILCNGKGCEVCKNTGYLEVAGAGMIHPFVLKQAMIDTNKYYGYAFGLGIERLVMLKYNIPDVRLFHSGDLRFIRQF
ncbi:MAG: phenylalanine--tRNA ligase subunit alpha [Minisyncoccia bacterium]|jgi:phenylalanyl-tRNA synthetase alpha chain